MQPRGQVNKHCSLKNSVNNSVLLNKFSFTSKKKMTTSRCHGQSKRIICGSFCNKPKDDGSTETPPLTISVTDTDTKGCKNWSRYHQHHRYPRTRGGLCSVWYMYGILLKVQTLRFVFSIYSFFNRFRFMCYKFFVCRCFVCVFLCAPFCVPDVRGGQKRASARNGTYRWL